MKQNDTRFKSPAANISVPLGDITRTQNATNDAENMSLGSFRGACSIMPKCITLRQRKLCSARISPLSLLFSCFLLLSYFARFFVIYCNRSSPVCTFKNGNSARRFQGTRSAANTRRQHKGTLEIKYRCYPEQLL